MMQTQADYYMKKLLVGYSNQQKIPIIKNLLDFIHQLKEHPESTQTEIRKRRCGQKTRHLVVKLYRFRLIDICGHKKDEFVRGEFYIPVSPKYRIADSELMDELVMQLKSKLNELER